LKKRGRPNNGNKITPEHKAVRMAVAEALMCNDLKYLDMTVFDCIKIARQIIRVFNRRKITIKK
jgi:hypothetical protein